MEVTYQEEREPSSWIGVYTVDKHEGGSKLVLVFSWNHVHHSSQVFHGIVPECPRHLLFSEIRSGHVYHDFLMGFDEAVGGLAASQACHNE
jgi:hypothetical protein